MKKEEEERNNIKFSLLDEKEEECMSLCRVEVVDKESCVYLKE